MRYVELLRGLFKNNDAKKYIRLAYLTGIMPVVRTKGQSAINNFKEYTMTNTKDLGHEKRQERHPVTVHEGLGGDFKCRAGWGCG